MNLTGQQRSATYPTLLSGSSLTPAAATRYVLTWGDGVATGVEIGNNEVKATRLICGTTTLQSAGAGTVTFPVGNGTVTLNPASGSYLVKPATGAFYLGQNNISIGSTAVNAHTFNSAATAARTITIEDVSGTMMLRPAAGNIHLSDTASIGAVNKTTLATLATAARAVSFPDADGTVVLQAPGQVFLTSYVAKLAADFSNSTVTPAAVPFPAITLPPGYYELKAFLILRSAATGTGARYSLPVAGWQLVNTLNGVAITAANQLATYASSATASPTPALTDFTEEKTLRFLLTAAGTFQPTLNSEIAASQVTMVAGSVVTFTKLD